MVTRVRQGAKIISVILSCTIIVPALAANPVSVDTKLRSVPDIQITLYAGDVGGARFLRFTSAGELIVSSTGDGRVIILSRDHDGDGAADSRRILLDGLNGPHGIDLSGGMLYVAEEDAIGRIAINETTGNVEGVYTRIITGLPQGGGHSTRTVRVGPDGKLYVTVGSSCNVCLEDDPRRAAMLRYDIDGSNGEIYAQGLRNAVGFDWRPSDGALFATDNGRDLLGDDFPPDELNLIEQSRHYGWPYAYGNNIPDPQLGAGAEEAIAKAAPPAYEFRAHNAPLGIAFVRNPDAPAGLRGAALVALHGSWNRSTKDGYKVVSLHWQEDGGIAQRDFFWGFLDNDNVIGRPVDIAEGPDGAFYVSDDYAGVIYRLALVSNRCNWSLWPLRVPSLQCLIED